MMKIYTNWAFLRPVNTSLHGDFTIENPSFSMYLLSTQEHTIPLCIKILQILFKLELSWFWIEGNDCFWDFLTFYIPLCSKKLSVHCVKALGSNNTFETLTSFECHVKSLIVSLDLFCSSPQLLFTLQWEKLL